MLRAWAVVGLFAGGCAAAWGQTVVIQNGTAGVQLGVITRPPSDGGENHAGFYTGISPGAQIQGIAIINGAVTIDGESVPPDVQHFVSRSGKHYRINRHGGSVDVREE